MIVRFAISVTIALLFGAPLSRAEEPPKPEFKSTTKSVTIGAGFETGTFGEAIPGQVGVESKGTQSFGDRKYLVNWQAAGGLRGGYGGNEHPGFGFLGGYLNLNGDFQYRFLPKSNWSPTIGGGGAVDGNAVGPVSHPPGASSGASNYLDGLTGVNGVLSTRFNPIGASYLNGRHSLLFTAFVQEALRSPGSIVNPTLYSEFGIHAQYDFSQSLSIMLEALYGVAPKTTDPIFSATDQASHAEAVLALRKIFANKMFVEFDTKISENGNKTTYAGSSIEYKTTNQLTPSIGLNVGIPIP